MMPRDTRRLFAHYQEGVLDDDRARLFVILRLAEEGDRRDLRWLVGRVGEETLRRALWRHGPRQLSRRSGEFWRRVLAPVAKGTRGAPTGGGTEAGAQPGAELWPR